jgi:hypothetical protein
MGWVVSVTHRPRFSPGETHCTGGWVGPITGLDTLARGKILSPVPWIEPRSPGRPARSQTLRYMSIKKVKQSLYTPWRRLVILKMDRSCAKSEWPDKIWWISTIPSLIVFGEPVMAQLLVDRRTWVVVSIFVCPNAPKFPWHLKQ